MRLTVRDGGFGVSAGGAPGDGAPGDGFSGRGFSGSGSERSILQEAEEQEEAEGGGGGAGLRSIKKGDYYLWPGFALGYTL